MLTSNSVVHGMEILASQTVPSCIVSSFAYNSNNKLFGNRVHASLDQFSVQTSDSPGDPTKL